MGIFSSMAVDAGLSTAQDAPLSASARRDAEALESAVTHARTQQANLEAFLRATDANPELSQEGRDAVRRDATSRFAQEMRQHLESTRTRGRSILEHRERQIIPKPMHVDPVIAEARGQTARMDARMALDAVPPAQLLGRMVELGSRDGAVAHLLATTDFGQLYLESRGGDIRGWQEARIDLARPYLSDQGRQALDDLTGLRPLAESAPAALEQLLREAAGRYKFRL